MLSETWPVSFLVSNMQRHNLGCYWVRPKVSKRSLDPSAKYEVGISVRPFKIQLFQDFEDFKGFLSICTFRIYVDRDLAGGFLVSNMHRGII